MNMKTKMETDEPVTFLDVYKEFSENVTEKYKINNFRSKVNSFSHHVTSTDLFATVYVTPPKKEGKLVSDAKYLRDISYKSPK